MNMRKLSINKACILLGTLLLLAVGAVCAAVYLPQRQEKRSSSSVPVQTLQNACFTQSTAVWMRKLTIR